MVDPERRRRRQRHGPAVAADHADEPAPEGQSAMTTDVYDPEQERTGRRRGAGPSAAAEDRETERGLRGLVGSGTSQVSVGSAMRARDAARPTDADLAEAEEHLVVVRRNWLPRDDAPRR